MSGDVENVGSSWNPAVWYRQSVQFVSEVRAEFRKVTWPTQKEAVAGTVGVVIVVSVLTAGLSLVDLVLGQLVKLILPS
jgi:preprotein translocase subunit SecE